MRVSKDGKPMMDVKRKNPVQAQNFILQIVIIFNNNYEKIK